MAPKDVHIIVLRTWAYGTLRDRRDFADMTEGADLDYPGGHSLIESLETETLSWFVRGVRVLPHCCCLRLGEGPGKPSNPRGWEWPSDDSHQENRDLSCSNEELNSTNT